MPRIANAIARICLLSDRSRALEYVTGPEGITIALPGQAPDAIDTVIVIELAGMPSVTPEETGAGEK